MKNKNLDSFIIWYDSANKSEINAVNCFVIRALCSLKLSNRIKICYEILRGIKYHDSITYSQKGKLNER